MSFACWTRGGPETQAGQGLLQGFLFILDGGDGSCLLPKRGAGAPERMKGRRNRCASSWQHLLPTANLWLCPPRSDTSVGPTDFDPTPSRDDCRPSQPGLDSLAGHIPAVGHIPAASLGSAHQRAASPQAHRGAMCFHTVLLVLLLPPPLNPHHLYMHASNATWSQRPLPSVLPEPLFLPLCSTERPSPLEVGG